jgi:hypothetical protein
MPALTLTLRPLVLIFALICPYLPFLPFLPFHPYLSAKTSVSEHPIGLSSFVAGCYALMVAG